jgi:hypothetical protein
VDAGGGESGGGDLDETFRAAMELMLDGLEARLSTTIRAADSGLGR